MSAQQPTSELFGESPYRTLVEEIRDFAIFHLDLEGRIQSWNAGAEILFGYNQHEIIGTAFKNLFTPEDQAEGVAERELQTAAETGRAENVRWHLRKDDSRFYANGVTTALRDSNGKLLGFAKIARDDTGRKRMEDDLRESEERYRVLFNSIDEGFCVCELLFDENNTPIDYRMLELNPLFEKLTGISAEAALSGKTIRQVVPNLEERWYQIYGGVALTGKPVRFVEGSEALNRWFDVYAFRIGEPQERKVAILFDDISERRRTELALEDARVRLEATLSAGEVGTWKYNIPDNRVYADKNLARMFSVSDEEAQGGEIKAYLRAVHADDRERVTAAIGRAIESGDYYEVEHRLVQSDNNVRSVIARGDIERDDHGTAINLPGVVIDITERKQAETALRESQQLNQDVLDSLITHISVLDRNGTITAVNRAWQQFAVENGADWTMQGVGVGANYLEVCRAATGENAAEAAAICDGIKNVLDGTEDFFSFEYPCHSPISERWFLLTASPLANVVGGAVVSHTNITKRKQAETALRESDARLRLALDISRTGTFEINLETDAVETDEIGREIYGWEPDEKLTFARVQSQFHPEDREEVARRVSAALAPTGSDEFEVEQRIIRTNGETRWIRVRGRAFFTGEGDARRAARCLGTYIDITAVKRAEAERVHLLEQQQLELQLRNETARLAEIIAAQTDIIETELDSTIVLQIAVERAQALTRADGAVVELVEGNDIVYRETSGITNGFLGLRLPLEKSLSGVCVRTGETMQCDNTETDARVNLEASRRIGARSMVIVPLRRNSETIGVLKVLSGASNAFDQRAVQTLELMAGIVGTAVTRAADYAAKQELLVERTRQGEFLEALLENVEDGVVACDANGTLSYFNRATKEFHGLPEEPLPAEQWAQHYDIFQPDGVTPMPVADVPLFRAFRGETVRAAEMVIAPKSDLAERTILASGRALFDADGEKLGAVVVMHDVTAERQAAAERAEAIREREARRAAEDANRVKDEFLATLSHELRTPLNAILGWAQMLRQDGFDPRNTQRAFETIERNARAQTQLIDDLLDVSRIITGKLRLDVRSVDLANVVTAAADAVRPAADAKQIRLQTLLDPAANAVSGDPDRLQQVVWNLLTNAVKFTPKGGRVQLRLERVNSHIEITVSDTGKGIEPEFLPHVFDRFRQADSSTTRRFGGLGLGLAIVRQLVELHGGTVSVQSAGEGLGTTFTVSLPLLPVRVEGNGTAPRVHPTAKTGVAFGCPDELQGLRVLVVDDEPDTRDLLVTVLESCAATVLTATSVAGALELLETQKFDVMVSDIGMPDEDGYSLISKIRGSSSNNGGSMPAVALTAYARAEDRVRALRAGFQMHITKPVEPAELIAVIANLAARNGSRTH